jgi:hypothetical protein
MWRLVLPATLAVAGTISMGVAIYHERRMHRHRQPGVTYAQATFRRDGSWRRTDIFTPEGLRHQQQASKFGVTGALLWVASLIVLVLQVSS